jgi:hypothetical protein
MKMRTGHGAGAAVIATLILFTACQPGKISKEQLIRLIGHSKELCQTQEINGIKVQAEYVPYQLLVQQEHSGLKKGDTPGLGELEKKYSAQYYFRLSFSKDNKEVIRQLGSYHRYSDMLQVFSFEMGNHINASTERNDTLPLEDYAFEQDYGMSSANKTLLVFAKKDFAVAREIRVNVGEFGLGLGDMTFLFRKEAIDRLPLLEYK